MMQTLTAMSLKITPSRRVLCRAMLHDRPMAMRNGEHEHVGSSRYLAHSGSEGHPKMISADCTVRRTDVAGRQARPSHDLGGIGDRIVLTSVDDGYVAEFGRDVNPPSGTLRQCPLFAEKIAECRGRCCDSASLPDARRRRWLDSPSAIAEVREEPRRHHRDSQSGVSSRSHRKACGIGGANGIDRLSTSSLNPSHS